jgi:hypothetical protein
VASFLLRASMIALKLVVISEAVISSNSNMEWRKMQEEAMEFILELACSLAT